MLFNQQTLARGWHQTKKFFGDGWNHATKLAGQIDSGMQVGRRLVGAIAPIFDQLGGSHHLKPIMSGITAYDKGKADVMHGMNNVLSHYHRVKRQVPELEL